MSALRPEVGPFSHDPAGFLLKRRPTPVREFNLSGHRRVVILKHAMRPFLTFLGIALLFCGCQPEDIRFDDNPVPHYDGVPTVVLDAYLTRAYIDLIGREPLQGEMESDRAALRAGNLGIESRLAMVDRLMGADEAYIELHDRKMFDDLSGRFLDGTSRETMEAEIQAQRFLAMQDSLAGGLAYLFLNLQADRLERAAFSMEHYREGTIDWREVNRRFCDNLIYDEINMNSFNFINATFDDLFDRYPTEAEFEQAYSAIEFGAPAVLFGEVIADKDGYLLALVNDPEFEEGTVRWWSEKLLVREISGAEMIAWRDVVGSEVDIRELQRLLISSDEYADFE